MVPANKKPRRALNGVLLLDKPLNMTSNHALQCIKRLYGAEKAGHTGSLDPLATGMLPICFGNATKFSQFLLEANKSYQVTARLGIKTASGDAEGEIIAERAVPELTREQLEDVCAQFRGMISQIPSMFSAVKVNGQPLYKLARKGMEIERPSRQVSIDALEIVDYAAPDLTLNVSCSKGTYIRTLVEDIGEKIGCGAYVTRLRRTEIAGLHVQEMLPLATLEALAEQQGVESLDDYILNLSTALRGFPMVNLARAAVYYLQQGQAVLVPNSPAQKWVQLHHNGQFLGMGETLADGRIAPSRLLKLEAKGLVA